MIRHIVFVKFKDAATLEQIKTFRDEVDKLPAFNPEVMNWVSGLSVEPRFHSGDFDWGLSVDLADWDAMDRYMSHEGHLRTGAVAGAVVESMLSFDFELEIEIAQGDGRLASSPQPRPSLRAGEAVVPELRGHTYDQGAALLAECNLQVADELNEIEGHVWAPGRIVATHPASGDVVAEGSTVELTVAKGWTSVAHQGNDPSH